MNALDLGILALVGFFLIRGLMRGFVREIASIVGIVLGIYLGYTYQKGLTEVALRLGLSHTPWLALGCFLAIFLATLILVRVFAWLITSILGSGALSFANRILGSGLSLLKAGVIVCVGVAILTMVLPADSATLKDSRIAPLALKIYQAVSSKIIPEMYKNWKQNFQDKGQKKSSRREPTI